MKLDGRAKYVAFAEESLRDAFDKLESGTFEDRKLYELLEGAIDDLKKDPLVGVKIPRNLWPKRRPRGRLLGHSPAAHGASRQFACQEGRLPRPILGTAVTQADDEIPSSPRPTTPGSGSRLVRAG